MATRATHGAVLENEKQRVAEEVRDEATPATLTESSVLTAAASSTDTSSLLTSPSSSTISSVKNDRAYFKKYWEYACEEFGATVSGMMLKPEVDDQIINGDRTELLAWIDAELRGQKVDTLLELGAGIGRLTPFLMGRCKKITAVDFIDEYIKQNQEAHATRGDSDEFLCADATKLSFPDESIDFLFWNWLLMYLSDEEIEEFILRSARWVKRGGYIFCRESCGGPSNGSTRDWAREGNPTEYRPGCVYTRLFELVSTQLPDIQFRCILMEHPVSVYKETLNSCGQLAWFLQRI